MREPSAVDQASSFQSDRERAYVLEQAPSFTEKGGWQVDLYFVKKTGPHDLLSGVRAAHRGVPATRGLPLACWRALSMPSVTKVNVVPPAPTAALRCRSIVCP